MGLELDYVFNPRSIAVVGASPDPEKQGHRFFRLLLEHHFPGPVYPINPRAQDVLEAKGYSSILDLPGHVDHVISSIPAGGVLQLIEQCALKGVKVVHFFTARFSETGRAELAELERELLRRARKAGIRVIGPNCMGIYHPAKGIAFKHNMPEESGPVGVLSQSGGNAVELVYAASLRGVRFSKVVSYGNALDLNEADLMDYFAEDPHTQVIGAYIEGVRDGPRFFRALRKAASCKPVVLLKGGRTEAGTRTVASHTASLAGSRQLWQALARQTGAALVQDMEEMADLLVAFRFCKPAAGLRVGVVGGGGGRSVQSADDCEEAGLRVEPFPAAVRQQLKALDPNLWDWIGNPADGSILGGSPLTIERILALMAESPEYDLLIANVGEHWAMEQSGGVPHTRKAVGQFIEAAQRAPKAIAIILGDSLGHQEWQRQALQEFRQAITGAGVALFPTVGRAARALSHMAAYYRSRAQA